MSMLSCSHVDVRIAGIQVVNGLELEIQAGQFWGLLGPNGIGKTTLLKCLAGLDQPAAGRILLESRDIKQLPRKLLARHIGMLQQHTVYVFDSSVLQTALTGRHPHLAYWEREGAADLEKASDALKAVSLEGFSERSVTGLSGGEARRVAFAALLVQEPEIMLLDEPTGELVCRPNQGHAERIKPGKTVQVPGRTARGRQRAALSPSAAIARILHQSVSGRFVRD
jgi:iron complex transport system ATP-binding protein